MKNPKLTSDARQLRFLRERWRSYAGEGGWDAATVAGMQDLREKLLGIGGIEVVPRYEEDLALLLARGREMKGPIEFVEGSPSRCHENVALLVESGFEISPATGWVLGPDDALWRQHSWGVAEDGTIIETTQPRTIYWGLVLKGRAAEDFCHWNT